MTEYILKCPIKGCKWRKSVSDAPDIPVMEYFRVSDDFAKHIESIHTHHQIVNALYSWAIHYSFPEMSCNKTESDP